MASDSKNISCEEFVDLLVDNPPIYINRRDRTIKLDSRTSEPYHFTDIEFYKVLMYFIDTNRITF